MQERFLNVLLHKQMGTKIQIHKTLNDDEQMKPVQFLKPQFQDG